MKLQLNLADSTVYSGFGSVPSGVYRVKIASTNVKKTQKDGYFIELGLQVVGGEHDGVTIAERLNIVNENADTVKYAKNTLKTILTYGEHKNPDYLEDSDEMLGIEVKVLVETTQEEYKDKMVDSSRIKSYFKVDKNEAIEPVAKKTEPVAAPVVTSAPPVAAPVTAPVVETAPPVTASAPASTSPFPWEK